MLHLSNFLLSQHFFYYYFYQHFLAPYFPFLPLFLPMLFDNTHTHSPHSPLTAAASASRDARRRPLLLLYSVCTVHLALCTCQNCKQAQHSQSQFINDRFRSKLLSLSLSFSLSPKRSQHPFSSAALATAKSRLEIVVNGQSGNGCQRVPAAAERVRAFSRILRHCPSTIWPHHHHHHHHRLDNWWPVNWRI